MVQVNVILFIFIILGHNEDKFNRYLFARGYKHSIDTQRLEYEEVVQVYIRFLQHRRDVFCAFLPLSTKYKDILR